MILFGEEYSSAYDHLYRDKNYEKECDFIETFFPKRPSKVSSILDLGGDTGGHYIILSQRGYNISGVDRSKEMINIAKRKTDNLNLHIDFINSDINNIDLNKRFDVIISMFSVINYQTTNETLSEFCRVVKKHLKEDGIFMFDVWYGPAVLSQKPKECIREVRIDNSKTIAGMGALEFAERLYELGVDTRPFFLGMHEQPVLKDIGIIGNEKYHISEMISKEESYLPSRLNLTKDKISLVVEAVKKIL